MALASSTRVVQRLRSGNSWKRDYPKIQIITIKELLEEGKKPALPPFVMPTYQQAQRVERKVAEQRDIFDVNPKESA